MTNNDPLSLSDIRTTFDDHYIKEAEVVTLLRVGKKQIGNLIPDDDETTKGYYIEHGQSRERPCYDVDWVLSVMEDRRFEWPDSIADKSFVHSDFVIPESESSYAKPKAGVDKKKKQLPDQVGELITDKTAELQITHPTQERDTNMVEVLKASDKMLRTMKGGVLCLLLGGVGLYLYDDKQDAEMVTENIELKVENRIVIKEKDQIQSQLNNALKTIGAFEKEKAMAPKTVFDFLMAGDSK